MTSPASPAHVNILGVGTYFPRREMSNADFDYAAAGVDPVRVARGGVASRRWAARDETVVDLAEIATRRALSSAGVGPDEVDRLILVTSTLQPGLLVPTGAVRLQSRLGLHHAQALTLVDTCCGSLIAMEMASSVVRSGTARVAVVVASETFSKTFNPTSPTTFEIGMSMGDSAGAVVLGSRPGWDDGLIATYGCSAASFQSGLGMRPSASGTGNDGSARLAFGLGPAPPSYDGEPLARSQIVEALKRFTTTTIPAAIRGVLERGGLGVSDVDFFVLHQPNRMFLEAWKAEVGVPETKTLDTLRRFGNLSSVSVLANLDAAWRAGRLAPGDTVVMASAGEGAVWGALAWKWRLGTPGSNTEPSECESAAGLTNVERHATVEILERLANSPHGSTRVSPGTDRLPAEVLVLDATTPAEVLAYLADAAHLPEWTISLREIERVDGGLLRATDRLSPTEETFLRVEVDAKASAVVWDFGHRAHRLWLTRRALVTDAGPVVGRRGTAVLWTTTRGRAPDPEGERWASLISSALAVEMQNLQQILTPSTSSQPVQDNAVRGGSMLFADQVAVVAGGSRGIGQAVCHAFAASGAAVAVVARDQHHVDATVAEIEKRGGRALGVVADCRYKGEVDSMLRTVVRTLGSPDILVNTIGGGQPELLVNTTDELFDRMVNLNIRTTFLLSRAVAPLLIEKERGKIIHTSSVGAKTPTPGLSVYDGCKAFVVAFTRDLALELGRFGIHVNCVCPGHVPTEATRSVGEKLCEIMGVAPQQLQESVLRRMAIPRFSSADDIARLYLFLASRESDYMTGQAVNHCSGLEMR